MSFRLALQVMCLAPINIPLFQKVGFIGIEGRFRVYIRQQAMRKKSI